MRSRILTISLILIFMAAVTWGLLEKSQEDNETIEQAIARLILEHNENEEAHLGVGQSLQSHKAAEIIDHVIGSVLADKSSDKEVIPECTFESLDNWTILGNVSSNGWPGALLYVEWGVVDFSVLSSVIEYAGNWLDFDFDMLFQASAWIDFTSNARAVLMIGDYQNWQDYDGFGFEINGAVVRGFFGNGTTTNYTADLSIDPTVPHVYRALYNAADGKVYFYVDGVLKGSISKQVTQNPFEPDIYFRFMVTGVGDGYMHVKKCGISRGL